MAVVYTENKSDTLRYERLADVVQRLLTVVDTSGVSPASLSYPARKTACDHIAQLMNRGYCPTIILELKQGGESCSVLVELNRCRAHHDDEAVVTPEGDVKKFRQYTLRVHANWCSSHFEFARAVVNAQLHKEAVELMATILSGFENCIIGDLE